MSDECRVDIDAIRAKLAAATPGPWQVWAQQPEVQVQNADGQCLATVETWGVGRGCIDADLIAHAPADLASLCDGYERVTHERDALRAEVVRLREGERCSLKDCNEPRPGVCVKHGNNLARNVLSYVTESQRVEIIALRGIIDGHAPPTDEEIATHNGEWLVFDGRESFIVPADAVPFRRRHEKENTRWWPLGPDGRPCAWPTVATQVK